MPLAMLGSAGLGLAWGWLLGIVSDRLRRPLWSGLALSVASLLMGGGVFLLADWRALASFAGAAVLAFSFFLIGRRALRARPGAMRS